MLRQRNSLPFLAGLGVWLAVAAIFLYTNLASAQQTSTASTLAAPELTAESSLPNPPPPLKTQYN